MWWDQSVYCLFNLKSLPNLPMHSTTCRMCLLVDWCLPFYILYYCYWFKALNMIERFIFFGGYNYIVFSRKVRGRKLLLQCPFSQGSLLTSFVCSTVFHYLSLPLMHGTNGVKLYSQDLEGAVTQTRRVQLVEQHTSTKWWVGDGIFAIFCKVLDCYLSA